MIIKHPMEKQTKKTMLARMQGHDVILVTKSGFRYYTNSLNVLDDETISFTDKYGCNVLLSIDEVATCSEVVKHE